MAKRFLVVDDETSDGKSIDAELGPAYDGGSSALPAGSSSGPLAAYSGLMESVIWFSKVSKDQYGDITYAEGVPIDVIWYDDERMIRTADKEELQQSAYIQTTSQVLKGDAITRGGITYPVIGIQKTPTFEGEQFRIANLGMRMI